jgi:hypothetical protein
MPTINIISTMPISANSSISSGFLTSASAWGPISIPVMRNPATAGIFNLLEITIITILAARIISMS